MERRETQVEIRSADSSTIRLAVTVFETGAKEATAGATRDQTAGTHSSSWGGDSFRSVRDVLLLHGWPNDGNIWEPLATEVLRADARFRLFAPTFRGYGASDKPNSGYDCRTFAADILQLVVALNLTQFLLVGHSMGGKIAQLIAAQQPAGLTTLTLLSPVPLTATPVPEERKAAQRAIYGDAAKTRDLIAGMVAHPLPEPTLNSLTEIGLQSTQAAFVGWVDTMREEDFTGELGKITVPTRILHGTKDPLRTEEALRVAVAEPIAHSEFAVIPNVGHLAHIEDPSVLALLLVNFWDNAQSGGI